MTNILKYWPKVSLVKLTQSNWQLCVENLLGLKGGGDLEFLRSQIQEQGPPLACASIPSVFYSWKLNWNLINFTTQYCPVQYFIRGYTKIASKEKVSWHLKENTLLLKGSTITKVSLSDYYYSCLRNLLPLPYNYQLRKCQLWETKQTESWAEQSHTQDFL